MKHYILIRDNRIIKSGRFDNVEKEVYNVYQNIDRTKDMWYKNAGEENEILFLYTK